MHAHIEEWTFSLSLSLSLSLSPAHCILSIQSIRTYVQIERREGKRQHKLFSGQPSAWYVRLLRKREKGVCVCVFESLNYRKEDIYNIRLGKGLVALTLSTTRCFCIGEFLKCPAQEGYVCMYFSYICTSTR